MFMYISVAFYCVKYCPFMFQGVNRQPRQPDVPPPNWERGHMIIADRYSTRVAGLHSGIPWTPEFWVWLPYTGRTAETKEDWRQRFGDQRPYAEDPGHSAVSPFETSSAYVDEMREAFQPQGLSRRPFSTSLSTRRCLDNTPLSGRLCYTHSRSTHTGDRDIGSYRD